ncbi:hypothetical protein KOR34_48660 [Posidoniimonas corsicana]|uniref:HAMP domain-containing protein n=1 Tax=Posidoniimonas corsicana TaxID=1938618 RepID=A0A5C5UVW6_9BACT|nr:hypothetical protein [Posidoniimonas corsicana]TWT30308.1 hypothetical protein KOR34_48660 [Posidoniimonas corsicana]
MTQTTAPQEDQPERRQKGALRLPVQKVIAARMIVKWLSAALVAIVLTMVFQWFADPTAPAEQQERVRALTWGPMAVALLATAPMAALDMARFSHSLVGPVVRLQRLVGELADGKAVPKVTFRKNDHWHDLAAEFNRLSAEVARLREFEAAHRAADPDDQLVEV